MKKDFSALSFSEKERICEYIFINNGPYWHIYTDGTIMQDIFCCPEDFKIGMWALAAVLHKNEKVKSLTFELMANHTHLILSGPKNSCIELFDAFHLRLRRAFSKSGRFIDWSKFKMNILPIEDLKTLRNEIIYANRNAYVSSDLYTPDSYPWGGGCAYFNAWIKHIKTSELGNLKVSIQRELLHSRDVSSFAEIKHINQIPFVPSFCDISLGESMFRNARSYFNSLTRNAEAFSQIAAKLKDSIFLTDEELFAVMCEYINKEYSVKNVSLLSGQQKIDVARHLHFKYNASNQQLRRLLKLEMTILNELFP